mmetsp:Transcript_7535/g.13887  ORF Transcript_7535/g.13887 Transcript_7535/m.13887 type:complete len:218 (-) Transcript_7535:450-1103(-)
MGTHDSLDAVPLAEVLSHILSEHQHHSSVAITGRIVNAKRLLHSLGNRVRPQNVVDALVFNYRLGCEWPLNVGKHIEVPISIAKPSVHNEDLVRKKATKRQALEGTVEAVVDKLTVRVAKSIIAGCPKPCSPHVLVNVAELMVATNENYLARVGNLECKDERNSLQLSGTPVNEITIEYVGRPMSMRKPEILQPQEQVSELPMEIAEDACGHIRINQ